MQQTPKPEAQFPSAVPPLSEHSVDEKHVPLLVVSFVDWHSTFGNVTTLNRAMAFPSLWGAADARAARNQDWSLNPLFSVSFFNHGQF